jgi:hypothetical protein
VLLLEAFVPFKKQGPHCAGLDGGDLGVYFTKSKKPLALAWQNGGS